MKVTRETRDKGFWITPLIAFDTNKPKLRFWFAWLFWLFKIDFNTPPKQVSNQKVLFGDAAEEAFGKELHKIHDEVFPYIKNK